VNSILKNEFKLIGRISMWEKYGKWLMSGLALLVVTAGLAQYRCHVRQTHDIAASSLYDLVIMRDDLKAAKEILADYPKTTYASLAALALAKSAVEENQENETEKYLQIAVKKARFDDVKWIATERLAKVLAAQKKFMEAEKLLTNTKIKAGYVPLVEEVKGDLYLMQDDRAKARISYKKALEAMPVDIPATRLQVKYSDVGGLLEDKS
jgi:predicted negative regulator of RcsB-dependent stress response